MIIRCSTHFDITATGVKNNFSRNRRPFRDDSGALIDSDDAWNRARNQQRNWETINQLISLRSLPYNISTPVRVETVDGPEWQFEFTVDKISELCVDTNDLAALKQDCRGVPMLHHLTERKDVAPILIPESNLDFEIA